MKKLKNHQIGQNFGKIKNDKPCSTFLKYGWFSPISTALQKITEPPQKAGTWSITKDDSFYLSSEGKQECVQ